MSTSANRPYPALADPPNRAAIRFDPDVGYARIPDGQAKLLRAEYRRCVADGRLTQTRADGFLADIAEKNARCAEADAAIKEEFGSDAFYGMEGTPLMLEDRWAVGDSM